MNRRKFNFVNNGKHAPENVPVFFCCPRVCYIFHAG